MTSLTQNRPSASSGTIEFRIGCSAGGQDPSWDRFLAGLDSNHHLQSSLWAEVKSLNGWSARRIIAYSGDSIVGGAQILFRKVRYAGNVGYVPKGPILIAGHESLAGRMVQQIREVAKSERIRVLFVQPPDIGAIVQTLDEHDFRPSPVETAPTATILIDLTDDLDSILSRMPKGMRNQVRRSQRRGINVREGSKDDLPVFFELLSATSRRRGFSTFDLEYFQTLWDVFAPSDGIKLFVAELNGEAVSAQFCIAFGDTVIAKQIGWSGDHGKLHPNEALDWFTIQWAKSNGYKFYDLEGIERPVALILANGDPLPDEFSHSPTAYKLRLGGEVVVKPQAYCFVGNPILRSVYNRVGFQIAKWPFVQKAAGRFRTG